MSRLRTRTVVLALAGMMAAGAAGAQASESETVAQRAVVRELFDAMRAGDSARVRAVFHPQMVALLTSDTGPDGKGRVSATPVDAFVRMVGTPRPQPIDERIFNPRVLIDGTLASVWVDYSLYVGPRFIHCGVDVFHVAKVGETWKIIALTDTRRTTGCTP
ncbi:MAG: nuclear transport factor 2 family protein [Gemmatimonadaceae bacterium]|nr:nuclear transport factor 2 family protein [Gemmatimonadaceae bacterium]